MFKGLPRLGVKPGIFLFLIYFLVAFRTATAALRQHENIKL
jgi:hypothetical protein